MPISSVRLSVFPRRSLCPVHCPARDISLPFSKIYTCRYRLSTYGRQRCRRCLCVRLEQPPGPCLQPERPRHRGCFQAIAINMHFCLHGNSACTERIREARWWCAMLIPTLTLTFTILTPVATGVTPFTDIDGGPQNVNHYTKWMYNRSL